MADHGRVEMRGSSLSGVVWIGPYQWFKDHKASLLNFLYASFNLCKYLIVSSTAIIFTGMAIHTEAGSNSVLQTYFLIRTLLRSIFDDMWIGYIQSINLIIYSKHGCTFISWFNLNRPSHKFASHKTKKSIQVKHAAVALFVFLNILFFKRGHCSFRERFKILDVI